MKKKLVIGCGLSVVLFLALVSRAVHVLMAATPKPEQTETVKRGDVEIKVVETGTIEPLHKVEIKSMAGGKLLKMLFEEGDTVHAGQVMSTVDPQEIDTQVAALEAQLKGAQAQLAAAQKGEVYQKDQTSTGIEQYQQNMEAAAAHVREMEADARVQPKLTEESIAQAQANLEAAQANLKALQESQNLLVQSTDPQNLVSAQVAYDQAKSQADNSQHNVDRQKALLEKGYVAKQVVEQAQTDFDVANAHLRDVKQKLDLIKDTNRLTEANMRNQVANAAGVVRQMEAALVQAQSSVAPLEKQQELANARAALAQAKAQLAAARSNKTQDQIKKDDIMAAEANVGNLQNQLDQMKVQRTYCTISSTMTGVVTKKYSEVGELITSAIASFSSGTPIYQVADLSTMLIKINVNEVDIAKLKLHLLTEVTSDSAKGALFIGHIRKVAPSALTSDSAGSSSASTSSGGVIRFPVEIQIDHSDSRLKPGMSARCAMIVARRKNVLRLPANCVLGTGDKATVQIVTDVVKDGQKTQKTESRPVVVGLRGDDYVEIVSGVKEGEKVRPGAYTGPPRKAIDIQMSGGSGGN